MMDAWQSQHALLAVWHLTLAACGGGGGGSLVSTAIQLPVGDTTLTARLRDTGGNVGPASSIVVRVTSPGG